MIPLLAACLALATPEAPARRLALVAGANDGGIERARLRYRENGRTWEEEVHSTAMVQMFANRSDMVVAQSSHCIVTGVRAARAPVGELDSRLDTLASLAALQHPVDRFFDEVMVMSDDPAQRDNRLNILKALQDLFLQVADISQLVVAK